MNSSTHVESGGTKNRTVNNNNYSARASSSNHRNSWLVPLITLVNIVVFLVVMAINNCPKNNLGFQGDCIASFLGRFSFQPSEENPLFGPSSSTLTDVGALRWYNIVHQHQGWRLFTCIWLHAGILHLLYNITSLVLVGIHLEQQFGFLRIGLIYLLSGFGGSVVSSLFIRSSISVGASGAVYGLLGANLSELLTNWTIYFNKFLFILILVVVNLLLGIFPHVDNFANIGGFVVGFLLGFILLPRPQHGWLEERRLPTGIRLKSKFKAYQYVLQIVSLIILIVGLCIGLVMLYKGKNGYDYCHWCHYLRCVPMPRSKWYCKNED